MRCTSKRRPCSGWTAAGARASCRPSSWRGNWAPARPCCRPRASPRRWSSTRARTTCPGSCWVTAIATPGGRGGTLGQAVARLAPDIDRIEVGQPQRARPAPVARAGRLGGHVEHRHPGSPLRPGRGRLRCHHGADAPAGAVLRPGQHRHGVPAVGGRRGGVAGPWAGGAGRVRERGGLRLLLRRRRACRSRCPTCSTC